MRRRVRAGLPPLLPRKHPDHCDRCVRVLAAAAADRGYGDRNRLFQEYSESEFSAYLLGTLDRVAGDRRAAQKARAIRAGHTVRWWKDRPPLD